MFDSHDGSALSEAHFQDVGFSGDHDLLGGEELDALLNGPGSFWDNVRAPDSVVDTIRAHPSSRRCSCLASVGQ